MNNLAQVGKQLSAIWAKLGLNQRISIVIGALAIVAGLASLLFWSSRPELSLLYGKLDDTESAKVINHLDEATIPYRISRSGGAIYIPDDKVHKTRMQLAMKGIPGGEGPGWELFDKPNFGISDFVQRANFLRAVQGELARTISQLDGGHVAHAVLGRRGNWLARATLLAAMALVIVRGQYNWVAMLVVVTLIGVDHPPVRDEDRSPGPVRTFLGWCSFLIPIVTFMPEPLVGL